MSGFPILLSVMRAGLASETVISPLKIPAPVIATVPVPVLVWPFSVKVNETVPSVDTVPPMVSLNASCQFDDVPVTAPAALMFMYTRPTLGRFEPVDVL